jgi:O-antigen ligase
MKASARMRSLFANGDGRILASDIDSSFLTLASIMMILLSTILASKLGYVTLILLSVPFLVYFAIYERNFSLYCFLVLMPFVISKLPAAGNIIGYGLFFIFFVRWVAYKLLSGKWSMSVSRPVTILLSSLILISIVSVLQGGLSQHESYAIVRLLLFSVAVTVLYDTIQLGDTRRILLFMSLPLVVASLLLFETYSREGSLLGMLRLYRFKVTGMLPNANLMGLLLLLVTPFWIAQVIWWRNRWHRLAALVLAMALTAGLVLTNARASLLGFAVAVILLAYWAKKLRKFILVCIILSLLIISVPATRTLVLVGLRVDRGLSSRDVIWSNTLEIIKENILFGVGLASYPEAYDPYFRTAWERSFFGDIPHAHNYILTKTAELGIGGFIWVLAFYYFPVKYGLISLRSRRATDEKSIVYGILAAIAGLFAHSIFEASGMMQEARIFPDIYYWIILIIIFKAGAEFNISKAESPDQGGAVIENNDAAG